VPGRHEIRTAVEWDGARPHGVPHPRSHGRIMLLRRRRGLKCMYAYAAAVGGAIQQAIHTPSQRAGPPPRPAWLRGRRRRVAGREWHPHHSHSHANHGAGPREDRCFTARAHAPESRTGAGGYHCISLRQRAGKPTRSPAPRQHASVQSRSSSDRTRIGTRCMQHASSASVGRSVGPPCRAPDAEHGCHATHCMHHDA
jgi:hypothetical protein